MPAWPASAAFWASSARGFSKRLGFFRWDARRAASWAAQCAALARAYVKGVSGRVAGGGAMDFMDRCPSTTPLGPDASSSASENSSFETSYYGGGGEIFDFGGFPKNP